MKKTFFGFVFLIFVYTNLNAQYSRAEYIQKYQVLAIEEMNRSGIPASITMAQACLESGNGNSELAKKSNNHFGIKCKSYWTGKKVYYDDDEENECFRKYKTVEESYVDHTNFLMDNPRYFELFQLPSDDYIGWAKGLKKAGYATARDYDNRLISIIEDYQLYRLDYRISLDELTASSNRKIQSENISDKLTIKPFNIHQITKINGVKAVVVNEGDTYEMIAQELGLEPWELYRFNDLSEGYRPQTNEIVYVEGKNKKTSRHILTHMATANETMHYISQLYGIKLKPLYRRNKMKFGTQPIIGQEILLHSKKRK